MHPPALHTYPTDSKSLHDEEKGHSGETTTVQEVGFISSGKEEGEVGYFEEDAPHGVKKFMAMRGLMSKKMLWFLWFGLAIAYFHFEFDNVCVWQYLPYATSSFGHHSLLSAVTVAAGSVAAVGKPVFSKFADTLGRGETYIICCVCYMIGYVLMSQSPTIGVYAGGYIFYNLGQTGTQILNVIIIADVTSTRWRSLATSSVFVTYIICVWLSSETVAQMLAKSTWRWGVRMMLFIMPTGTSVIVTTLFLGEKKARDAGLIQRKQIKWKALHLEIYEFCSQIDLGGIILLGGGVAFILVSCALAATLPEGWASPPIIASLVLGPIFLIALPIYERQFAKYPLVPFIFFKNSQLMIIAFAVFTHAIAAAISDTYKYSWMVVTQGWSTQHLTYFTYANYQVSTLAGILAGLYMFYFRRYKWLVVGGSALYTIGMGIQFQYRTPQQNRGLLIMVQIIQGFASGVGIQILATIAQFEFTHKHTASVIAFVLLVQFIAASVGDSIAGAMWTNFLPGFLRAELPDVDQSVLDGLFADIFTIPAFGDPVRDGMVRAYMTIRRRLTIASLALSFIPIICTVFIHNKELTDGHDLVTIPLDPIGAEGATVGQVIPFSNNTASESASKSSSDVVKQTQTVRVRI
ncbi:hypothetical protein BDY24DRAFT_365840 [Mrakia frigida]|uniref:uncharacterized protein n=1 Tax=Mrakia frigida TaxID=29902 RepID=UPI003FCC06C9